MLPHCFQSHNSVKQKDAGHTQNLPKDKHSPKENSIDERQVLCEADRHEVFQHPLGKDNWVTELSSSGHVPHHPETLCILPTKKKSKHYTSMHLQVVSKAAVSSILLLPSWEITSKIEPAKSYKKTDGPSLSWPHFLCWTVSFLFEEDSIEFQEWPTRKVSAQAVSMDGLWLYRRVAARATISARTSYTHSRRNGQANRKK